MNHVPKWLEGDIKDLGLEGVRLSCAIYELYDYYANSKTPDGVDDSLHWLELVNDRLDFLDANMDIVLRAIR